MKIKRLCNLFVLIAVVMSCSKQKRIENRLDGYWEVEEMRVIDGQGFTHYIGNAVGGISLNFDSNTSDGLVSFQTQYINEGQVFPFDFSGDSLILDLEKEALIMGENDNRTTFSIVMHTPKDLVLEYYDFNHYQLRKYIFRKN